MLGERRPLSAKVNVVFVSDNAIKDLNRKFVGTNRPTDVLAFDLGEDQDIVVSVDAAVRQARIFKTSYEFELYLYVVHGILHMLGYDDKTARQRKLMNERAVKYVSALPWL